MLEDLPKKSRIDFHKIQILQKCEALVFLQKSLKEQRLQSLLQTKKTPQLSRVAYPAHDPTSPFPHKNNLMSLGQVFLQYAINLIP